MRKKIVITMGDPCGCGPVITLTAAEKNRKNRQLFIVGDKAILERCASFYKLARGVVIIDVKTPGIKSIKPGRPSKLSGLASLNYIKEALKFMNQENIKALVTAPVSKEAIQLNVPRFHGHTELLAEYFGTKCVVMMMVCGSLRVALLTRHLSLRKVPGAVTRELVKNTIRLVYFHLKEEFGIRNPKIAIAGLNPHAGINTFLSREEKIIKSAIHSFSGKVYGPYPSDTLFLKDKIKQFDCIIASYHDQAMIPFKLLSLWRGVNLTLGLPIIRTSPAHGVAFDIMGAHRIPHSSSMAAAIRLADRLTL